MLTNTHIFYMKHKSNEVGEFNMFTVHFFENKNLLLSQCLQNIPSEGESLKIKGRQGKVLHVHNQDIKTVHVEVQLDSIIKSKQIADGSKKKKK